jgi:hypothetical protein
VRQRRYRQDCLFTTNQQHRHQRKSLKLKVLYTAVSLTLSVVFLPQSTLAQNTTPQIQISVADPLLEQNIRAHIGVPAERCNIRQNRLNRLLPGIRRDIDRAVQAQSIDLTFTVEQ